MRATLLQWTCFALILCLLNGALFNRIGARIAEQSYISVILDKAMCTLHIHPWNVSAHAIKYSRRMVPNQQPNQGTNGVSEPIITDMIACEDKLQAAHLNMVAALWLSMLEEKICKPFLNVIIKPPIA